MNKEEIIEIVKEYVKSTCENDTTGHDWWHIQRVYNIAMRINEQEKADEFIITLIVLLHDLYDHKFYKGDSKAKLIEILKELKIYDKLKQEEIENTINSCVNLGFSANFDKKQELSKEGKIAQDADRIDGMGAMAIARTFTYGGKTGKPIHDPNLDVTVTAEEYRKTGSRTSISHFYDKCLKLKDQINTQTAKKIAIGRHKYLEEYLEEFFKEWDGEK